MRYDLFSQHPINREGVPQTHAHTPCPLDLISVVDVVIQDGNYRPVNLGTPLGPGQETMILVARSPVQGNGAEKFVRHIYSNARRAEDAVNAVVKYISESITHPVYIRRYLELRETYAARTKGAALTTIANLKLTAGGTLYPNTAGAVTVVFTGGAGTGAAAVAEVQGGIIVALRMTNGGTGYTSAPAISFTAATGSGATATASIQPTTAVLVEEETAPADGPEGSLFYTVTRVYMTLPGPITTRQTTDEETRTPVLITSQLIATPSFPIAQTDGSRIEFMPTNTVYGTKITTTINGGVAPSSFEMLEMHEYSFPALVFGITGTPISGRETVVTNTDRRSAFTQLTQYQRVFVYGTESTLRTTYDNLITDSFPNFFNPRLNDLIYNGLTFSVNEQNVLNDAFSVGYSSGAIVENYAPAASSPSATEYTAEIGEWAYIGVVLKPWRVGWWRLEAIRIVLR